MFIYTFMEKPQVRIIEDQVESITNPDVSQSERNYLLSKYGYVEPSFQRENISEPSNTQSFEDMVRQEELKEIERRNQKEMRNNRPRAYTFDDVNHYESKHSSLDVDGANLGINVTVMSDMNIFSNNQRRY